MTPLRTRTRPHASRYQPHYGDAFFRRLLAIAPFERRPRGGWRFGTKLISEAVIFRLVTNRHAIVVGDRVLPFATIGG